jgi:hypothetical protein
MPMLIAFLALIAFSFGLWFTYMVRYPKRWVARVDAFHQSLRPYGLSFQWMQRMEKGISLKILVVVTAVLTLSCVAVLLRHPTAMSDFLQEYSRPRL